jgi:ABC-type multidrug transport system ATPase subunit
MSGDESNAILATGLSRTFGRGAKAVVALDGLSFAVARGESLALLGANGSGKSTTLRLVLGLLTPTAGRVDVLGGPAGRREARAATGYVPEESRRLPPLTGREVVDLFARVQGVAPRAERRRRVDEALALCGLDAKAAARRVPTYSRGMTRRLALAAAWAPRPALLVLDEPTSGLDPLGTEEVLALLRARAAEGGTTLLSTHDRVAAEGACDRALVLSGGRAAAEGRLADLLAGDASPSLAPLLRRASRA